MKSLIIPAMTLFSFCQVTTAQNIENGKNLLHETESRISASLNSKDAGDAYSWLSADGLRVYYHRDGTFNAILKAERPNLQDAFGEPTLIPVQGLAEGVEIFSSWLSRDEQNLFFVTHEHHGPYSTTIYAAKRSQDGKSYTDPVRIELTGHASGEDGDIFISGPSFTPSLDELFVYYSDNTGTDRIAWYLMTGESHYQFKGFVNNGLDYCPGTLSDNGLSYYLTRRNDQNILVKLVRSSLLLPFGQPQEIVIESSDSSGLNYYQPMVSPEVGLLSITTGQGSWVSNDLQILSLGRSDHPDLKRRHHDTITDLPEENQIVSGPDQPNNSDKGNSPEIPAAQNTILTLWPNPASTSATLHLKNSKLNEVEKETILEITDLTGRILRKIQINPGSDHVSVDVTGLANGIYVCRITGMEPVRLIVRH